MLSSHGYGIEVIGDAIFLSVAAHLVSIQRHHVQLIWNISCLLSTINGGYNKKHDSRVWSIVYKRESVISRERLMGYPSIAQGLLPCGPAFDNTAEHDRETAGTNIG
jgi:hypothetical protein